jgi:peptidylprolyl isomerase
MFNNQNKNMENSNEVKEYKVVVLHTNMGDISIELAKDKPLTTSNFIKLASSNFYNNVKFHRVINGFMIQTGDPLSKDDSQKMYWGTGGPGYKFADELTGSEKYVVGTVAMANSGPNTNGSQFFIMTSDTPLPPSYTVFGKVIAGQDVAQKIQDVATDANDRPISDIIINSIDLK